jgi:peptidoglycan hydrolase-like protein with peptidoglycan-binding domain
MRVGDSGPDVAALQNRLVELGYWLGDPAGTYGTTTQQAVMALQKVQGIGRDGAVGPETRAALSVAQRPVARSAPGSGRVMEVDLARQVIFVVDGGVVTLALNTSTGRSGWSTPSGRFAIGRTVNGTDTGPYGALYRPRYFYRGIAVHGSPSIPGYPASHGCTRVSNAAIDMLWAGEALPKGTSVWVY